MASTRSFLLEKCIIHYCIVVLTAGVKWTYFCMHVSMPLHVQVCALHMAICLGMFI